MDQCNLSKDASYSHYDHTSQLSTKDRGIRRPGSGAHSSTQAGKQDPGDTADTQWFPGGRGGSFPTGPGALQLVWGGGVPTPQRFLFPLSKLERLLLLLLLQPLPQLLHLLPPQFQEPPLLLLQFLSHCLLHGLPGGLW